jgi:hypothetical protein
VFSGETSAEDIAEATGGSSTAFYSLIVLIPMAGLATAYAVMRWRRANVNLMETNLQYSGAEGLSVTTPDLASCATPCASFYAVDVAATPRADDQTQESPRVSVPPSLRPISP